MKVMKKTIISVVALLLMSSFLSAQGQTFTGGFNSGSDSGVKLFLETDRVTLAEKQNNYFASKSVSLYDLSFYGIKDNGAASVLPFQKVKVVSGDFIKNNAVEKIFVRLNNEDETTYKKKSSIWSSDFLYFAAGVVAATAAYFLISGTSEATSSQKTFGYPPPPSN